MKIWGQIPKVPEVYGKNKVSGKVNSVSGVTSKKDVVSISNEGKDFQVAMKAVKEVPDIREEKVEEIKQKIKANAYEVTGKDIVEKVIKSIREKMF